MNTLLTMNLTGSVLLIFYFLVKHFLGERLTKKYLYRILQINVICFLVPLMMVGEIYRGLWWDIKILLKSDEIKNFYVTSGSPVFLQIQEKIDLSLGMKGRMILIGTYLFLVVFSFVIALLRDMMRKRPVRRAIQLSGISVVPELAELQREMKIRKTVKVCLCRDNSQIATIGMFRPIIFFKDPKDDSARRMILRHEMYHVKAHDVLWRWIAICANCIHFYNPLIYVLRREIERMQELRCDEQATAGLDAETLGRYANLLVENSKAEPEADIFSAFFGEKNSYKKLKERIKCIMRKDAKKKFGKRLTVVLTAVILGTTSLTALAYDEMNWWHKDGDRADSWHIEQTEEVTKARAYAYSENDIDKIDEDYPVLYEREYIDADGNVYPFNEEVSPNAFCIFHKYVDYKVVEHYSLTNGGCEVWYYDAVMCEKCHYTKSKELTKINEFPVCPHTFPDD